MDLLLFILTTATLFIRPAEIVTGLAEWPIYELLILSCLAVSFGGVVDQLRPGALRDRPITVCVLGMLAAIMLSHIARFNFFAARYAGLDFVKVVIYYLLVGAVLKSPEQLRLLLKWLVVLTACTAGLAVLQYHELINISALEVLREGYYDSETGDFSMVTRLRSTGIFNDPNDLSMVLVVGLAISASWLLDPRLGAVRVLSMAPLALFGYALALTKSRGGLLALLTAMLVLFQARFGWRKTLVLVPIVLPLMFLLFAGRQTEFTTSEGTSQQRIQFWSEGLAMFRQAPVFGIGSGNFVEQIRHVAHNSYVQCYTELGFFGGTVFFTAFAYPLWTMYRLGRPDVVIADPELRRVRPFLMAAVAGYAAGMASLSRSDVVPTYLVLGLANAYLRFANPYPQSACPRFDGALVRRFVCASFVFLALIYVFVRVFARWV